MEVRRVKKDIPLFVFGIISAITALSCSFLQILPILGAEEEIKPLGRGQIVLEKNDIEILSHNLTENDYSALLNQKFTQAEEPSSTLTVEEDRDYPVENSVEMTLGGGIAVENFYVNQESGTVDVDLSALSREPLDIDPNDGEITVLLYHTHTSEAYANEAEPGLSRSDDPKKTVVAVGNAMKEELERNGISVIHDTTVHDTTYTGSYGRSEATVTAYLAEHPEIDFVIDIHRDGLLTSEGVRIQPTAEVNGKKAAQVMIITGCDPDGSLELPNWQSNLKAALHLQREISALSPDLARPLFYCNRNYNQNLSPGALLIECGTDANRLEEVIYSGELLGKALSAVILENNS